GEGEEWGVERADWHRPGGDALRDAVKVHSIKKLLYQPMRHVCQRRGLWPLFCRHFPTLSSTLAALRFSRAATSDLNRELQQREAGLFLGRIIPRVAAEVPGCLPVSLHDGILCQRRFARDVQRIVEEEAEAIFGVRPLVRIKGAEDR